MKESAVISRSVEGATIAVAVAVAVAVGVVVTDRRYRR